MNSYKKISMIIEKSIFYCK